MRKKLRKTTQKANKVWLAKRKNTQKGCFVFTANWVLAEHTTCTFVCLIEPSIFTANIQNNIHNKTYEAATELQKQLKIRLNNVHEFICIAFFSDETNKFQWQKLQNKWLYEWKNCEIRAFQIYWLFAYSSLSFQ